MIPLAELRGDWDYATLPSNIRVGRGCYLERRGSFDRVRSRNDPALIIGEGARVYTWTQFSIEPTGLVEVGDRSVLVGVSFMCAERITIGRDVLMSYQVTVMDSDFHSLDIRERGADAIASAPDGNKTERPLPKARPVTVGDGSRIGIGAIVLKGVTIGEGACIEPGSVVTTSVPPGTTWAGNPARQVSR